jgi:hypothetical protein
MQEETTAKLCADHTAALCSEIIINHVLTEGRQGRKFLVEGRIIVCALYV